MKLLVGNDIVDLTSSEVKMKYLDQAFINRVLTLREKNELSLSDNPQYLLWQFWSAKEACYKLLKKLKPAFVFSPSQIEIKVVHQIGSDEYAGGSATCLGEDISIFWETTTEYIHAIALHLKLQLNICHESIRKFGLSSFLNKYDVHSKIQMENDNLLNLEKQLFFTEREELSIYSSASRQVRLLAKELLAEQQEWGIEIVREKLVKKFAPPALFQNGVLKKKGDLSLSHDGEYLSSVVSIGRKWC